LKSSSSIQISKVRHYRFFLSSKHSTPCLFRHGGSMLAKHLICFPCRHPFARLLNAMLNSMQSFGKSYLVPRS
jgi:hypothetical protein